MPPRPPAAARLPALCALFVFALAAPARAALSTPGVNLRWDHCYDDGGGSNKTFACDTNSGSETLVVSFVLSAPMASVSGLEYRIEVMSASASLPAWWQFRNVGSCRLASLSLSTVAPPGSANCIDWAIGPVSAGIGAYDVGFGAHSAMLSVATAVHSSSAATLDPDIEYFAGSVVINHAKTVGTGACGGCDVPVCLILSQLRVDTLFPDSDILIWNGANYEGSQIVSWQSSYVTGTHTDSNGAGSTPSLKLMLGCVPYSTVATRPSNWGALKSLYR